MAYDDPLSVACAIWWTAPVAALGGAGLVAAWRERRGPGHRPRPAVVAVLGVLAAACFAVGGAVTACGCPAKAVVAFGAAFAASIGLVWFARADGPGDEDGGDGGGGQRLLPPDPQGPSGDTVDWEAFEREFAAYTASRDRLPA